MELKEILPAVSAGLNSTAALLLVAGLAMIKAKRVGAHKACMLAAFAVSIVFLGNYLYYHYTFGGTKFAGEGWTRPVYFFILFTHIPLAAVVPVLAIVTIRLGFHERWDRHRKWAKITFPIWMYVSVTGVLVYLFLYQWFPAAK